MILPYRPFVREAPSREAKSVYIFCEGARREYDYFCYFKELDSRINVEVYKLDPHEDNSPLGLLNIVRECIEGDKEYPPRYDFIDGDEVWIVLDVDKDLLNSRETQIELVKSECLERDDWHLTISNPCFEVWLYYHMHEQKPEVLPEISREWKQLVDSLIPGGFNSSRHPLLIEQASKNAERNHKVVGGFPDVGCTEVFHLADSILPLIRDKIKRELKRHGL